MPEVTDLPLLNVFGKGFQFLRADRITPSVTYPKSQNTVRHHRSLGPRGEFTAHFLLEFGDEITTAPILRHVGAMDATSLNSQLSAWMQEFSPGVRVEVASIPMTDFVRLVFSYRGEGVAYGEPLRATNIGFGLTHSLPVVTACLAAQAGSLVVIENPEAQLHPAGQVAVGRLLGLTAANGVQLIIETHSDHVLNGIRLTVKEKKLPASEVKLHFFTRSASGRSSFESPALDQEGRLSYWPLGFFDQWENSLDQLLEL